MGDRLRVIAPTDLMPEVTAHLGDSDRGISDISVGGLALGLAVGVAVGLAHLPLPGGGFAVGAAAGTLLSGLVFGRVGQIGPVVTSMSHGAAQSLSALGRVTSLAFAGGPRRPARQRGAVGRRRLAAARARSRAHRARRAARAPGAARGRPDALAGDDRAVAGVQAQPAVLAFVNERTGYDTRVGVGYALVYPVAMIVKILVAQVLATLG